MPRRERSIKKIGWWIVLLLLLLNVVAAVHAYKFTHFSAAHQAKNYKQNFSAWDKVRMLFTGIDQPRPVNKKRPDRPFECFELESHKRIACWLMRADSSKGTVILFHGYGGEKSSMLDKAYELLKMGYSTLLVDFMGSGGSEGAQTTIGYREAEEVKTCYDYLQQQGEKNIHLLGTSMGAVAILKALHDDAFTPRSIILECPFGTMYQTVCARFRMLGVPTFPMAGLLVFWGGVENGFWAFSHNPQQYALRVHCPTLLLWGEKDPKVSRQETNVIYQHLQGSKQLYTFPLAGHENYLAKYRNEWVSTVQSFLDSHK